MTLLPGRRPPLYLPSLDTWAIPRPIGQTGHWDAMGPYPVTPLEPTSDLDEVREILNAAGLVSWVGVTDVLQPNLPRLDDIFDYTRSFKTHHLVDRSLNEPRYTKHHRYEVRRAQRTCETRVISLHAHLTAWKALYADLISRHAIGERQQFSDAYMEMLADSPDVTPIGAFVDEELVSAHLWVTGEDGVHSHLAASNPAGYRCGASYAVYDHAISHFTNHTLIDLGGVASAEDATSSGLARFKKGFANAERTNFIVGLVGQPAVYHELCEERSDSPTDPAYFPAYRSPFP